MSGNEEAMDADHPPMANIFSEEDEQTMTNEGDTEQDTSSMIDASIPWDQRDSISKLLRMNRGVASAILVRT